MDARVSGHCCRHNIEVRVGNLMSGIIIASHGINTVAPRVVPLSIA